MVVVALRIAGSPGGNGVMTYGPLPGMLNSIESPPEPALASRIACRREPGPESLVFVTMRLAAPAKEAARRAKTGPRTRQTVWVFMSGSLHPTRAKARRAGSWPSFLWLNPGDRPGDTHGKAVRTGSYGSPAGMERRRSRRPRAAHAPR